MHSRTHSLARTGFTLVETTIVVLLLGVASAIAVPKYVNSLCRYRVDSAAKRIAADLELAQRRARTTSANQPVVFTSSAHKYVLTGLPDLNRPGTDYTVKLNTEPFNTTLVSVDFGGTSTLTYNGHGRPSAGGTVVIRASTAQQRTITVNADSGKATIQ